MVAGHPQLPQAEAPAGSHFSMVPQAGHLTVGREGPGAGRFGLPSLASADLPLRLVKPRGCTWLPGLGGVGLGGVGFGEWAFSPGCLGCCLPAFSSPRKNGHWRRHSFTLQV